MSDLPLHCPHCAQPSVKEVEPFCCVGCKAAYTLLEDEGLLRYYDLKEQNSIQKNIAHDGSWTWAEAEWLEACERAQNKEHVLFEVRLFGMHCAACGWLIEQLFKKEQGAVSIEVLSGRGVLRMVASTEFEPVHFLSMLRELGYSAGSFQSSEAGDAPSSPWVRFGVVAAIAMNVMLLSLAFYFGLDPKTAPASVVSAFGWVSLVLTGLAVAIGGPVFFKSGLGALRRGMLHLDLPIALGLLLAYGGSVLTFLQSGHEGAYFDSVVVFLTLMLGGRALQERTLQKNQDALDDDNAAELLRFRRYALDGSLHFARAHELKKGDSMLLAPQDLNVCRAVLRGENSAVFSLEWLTGESEPKTFYPEDVLPAGALLVGEKSVKVEVSAPYQQSFLTELLAPRALRVDEKKAKLRAWVLSSWTLGVLALAVVAFVYWWQIAGSGSAEDAALALDVVVAILVVSCPCALGLAAPLSQEVALSRLRKAGVWIREASFLERALKVEHLFFDKTGTLTEGALEVKDASFVEKLEPVELDVLHHMVSRSNHPRSKALLNVLPPCAPLADVAMGGEDVELIEVAGEGLICSFMGHEYRLGKGDAGASAFSVKAGSKEKRLGLFEFSERQQKDLRATVAALIERGIDVTLLSGDHALRVQDFAKEMGLANSRAIGGLSPAEKASFIIEVDNDDTLMLGDGLNDTLAFSAAFCAGAPAGIHASLPVHTDFVLSGAGLRGLIYALDLANRRHRVVYGNYVFAFVYNLIALSLAASGVMTPLFCAVLMPLSSLVVVVSTLVFTRVPMIKSFQVTSLAGKECKNNNDVNEENVLLCADSQNVKLELGRSKPFNEENISKDRVCEVAA